MADGGNNSKKATTTTTNTTTTIVVNNNNLSSAAAAAAGGHQHHHHHQQQGKTATTRIVDGKLGTKHVNIIHRTTSESLRLGGDQINSTSAAATSAASSSSSSCTPLPPSTLANNNTSRKTKNSSFQITSVTTVGQRANTDNGEDSADDLDESHTDDNSRITDLENETPSYSEDTFSKEDVFFSNNPIGSAPVIPTSSQYGLAIVTAPDIIGNGQLVGSTNISDVHAIDDINMLMGTGQHKQDGDLKEMHHRNERFKVVKIESTEPFKRGRWMCMDFLDHHTTSQQPSSTTNTAAVNVQPSGGGKDGTADSGVVMTLENNIDMSDNPYHQHHHHQHHGSDDKNVHTDSSVHSVIHGSTLHANVGSNCYNSSSTSTSPGQTLQQSLNNCEMSSQGNNNVVVQTSHAQTMSHVPINNSGDMSAGVQTNAFVQSPAPQSMPQQQLQQLLSNQSSGSGGQLPISTVQSSADVSSTDFPIQQSQQQMHIDHQQQQHQQQQHVHNAVQGQSQPAQFYATTNTASQQTHPMQGQTLPANVLHNVLHGQPQQTSQANIVQTMSMGHDSSSSSSSGMQTTFSQQPLQQHQGTSIDVNAGATADGSPIQTQQQQQQHPTDVGSISQPQSQILVNTQQELSQNYSPVQQQQPTTILPSNQLQQQSSIVIDSNNQSSSVVVSGGNSVSGGGGYVQDQGQNQNFNVSTVAPQVGASTQILSGGTIPNSSVVSNTASVPTDSVSVVLSNTDSDASASAPISTAGSVQIGANDGQLSDVTANATDGAAGGDETAVSATTTAPVNADDSESCLGLNLRKNSSIDVNQRPNKRDSMSDDKINILYTGSRRESNVFTNLALGNCMENIMNITKGQSMTKQQGLPIDWNFSTTNNSSSGKGLSHKSIQNLRREESSSIAIPKIKRSNDDALRIGSVPCSPTGRLNYTLGTTPAYGSAGTSPVQYGSYLDVGSGNSDNDRISRGASPQPFSGSSGDYSASGTSAVAIDNKIEQAMDLVKSHLMFAVREEVEVLKEKIAELMDRINQLEVENTILKANASQETLTQLLTIAPTKPPQNPNPTNGPIS